MNRLRNKTLLSVLLLAAVLVPQQSLPAQDSPPPVVAATRSNASSTRLPPGPFLVRPDQSPVDLFRQLLAVKPLERFKLLAGRPPGTVKLILAKVHEYQSLKPEQRELRLRATELRWYLWPLMNMAPANRAPRLAQMPPDIRKLVEDRLAEWDKLPASLQRELLDNEATVRYFTETAARTPEERQTALQEISPARRQMLEAGIRQWQSLPIAQRAKIASRFDHFFSLTAEEKDKTLSTLSEPEREQIEKTLDKFSGLSPFQRIRCLRSFEKFTSLTLEERQQFLKNAERWKLMTPSERQAWKDLVTKLSLEPSARLGLGRPFMPLRPGLPPQAAVAGTNAGRALAE